MPKTKPKRSDNPTHWDWEVSIDILIINRIIDAHILDEWHGDSPANQTFAHCAFTQLMVHLRDLLIKADREGLRLDHKQPRTALDVTDIVVKLRDAACHIESKDNFSGKSRFAFCCETLANGDIVYSYGTYAMAYRGAILTTFSEVQRRLANV